MRGANSFFLHRSVVTSFIIGSLRRCARDTPPSPFTLTCHFLLLLFIATLFVIGSLRRCAGGQLLLSSPLGRYVVHHWFPTSLCEGYASFSLHSYLPFLIIIVHRYSLRYWFPTSLCGGYAPFLVLSSVCRSAGKPIFTARCSPRGWFLVTRAQTGTAHLLGCRVLDGMGGAPAQEVQCMGGTAERAACGQVCSMNALKGTESGHCRPSGAIGH